MRINKLRMNHLENAIGYRYDNIFFSWNIENTKASYCKELRILVAEKDCFTKEVIAYDSGILKQYNKNGLDVSFPLKPRTRYYWMVWMTGDNGEEAKSKTAYFETGKLTEKWGAKWISTAGNSPAMPRLYKQFPVKKEVEMARVYMYGLGLYESYCNGKKAGDEYLLPGYHSYDLMQEYQTFDITSSLQLGNNQFEVILGEGWYKGRFVFEGGYENLYGDKRMFLAEIHITYLDGTTEKIISDLTWEAEETSILDNNIYDGETIDQTREKKMLSVIEVEESYDKLIERMNPPIRKTESFKPIQLIHTPNGQKVLDFGEMITGWVAFLCKEQSGVKMVLSYSEVMQDGNFYNDNLRTAKAQFTYITDGTVDIVRPHFTYYSFRYVKVEGSMEINPIDFTAYGVMSDLDAAGEIVISNQLINQLIQNTIRSQKCNFLDIPTDCPQRDERLGWTGDTTVFASTACFNLDSAAFYHHFLINLQKEQELLHGAVPFFVPYPKPKPHEGINPFLISAGACTWGDVATILPWTLYEHYRDLGMLRKHYPIMKSWVSYVKGRASRNKNPYLWQNDRHLGDWLALDNGDASNPIGKTDSQFIASAYYYYSTLLCLKASRELGLLEESKQYETDCQQIKQAFLQEYFDGYDNLKSEPTQTAYAIILKFGLCEGNKKEKTIQNLKKLLLENNSYLNTGFVGTGLLCPVLSENGLNDLAYTLLLNEEYLSWLYAVKLGATTIWERWNSILENGTMSGTDMNSLNHYAYGCITDWMYRYMCGFIPSVEERISMTIKPMPDSRIQEVKATYYSAFGLYKMHWKYKDNDMIHYDIEVPFNTRALLILPDGRKHILEPGKHKFS